MCQTRCGKSQLKRIYEGITVNNITSIYSKIGSTVIEAVEPFPYVCEFCCKIEQYWIDVNKVDRKKRKIIHS